MIINLSYKLKHVKTLLEDPSFSARGHRLLDVAGVCSEIENIEVLSAQQFDRENEIRLRSLESYSDFAAEASHTRLGKDSIRSLQIKGFSVFWITELSVKHDHYHWGMLLFYLRQLLMEKPEIFQQEKEIHLILDPRHYACIDWLKQIFLDKLEVKINIHGCKLDPLRSIRWIRIYFLFFLGYFRLLFSGKLQQLEGKAREIDPSEERNYFFSADMDFNLGKKEHEQDQAFNYAKSLEMGLNSSFFPNFLSFDHLRSIDWSRTDKVYLQARPNFWECLSFIGEIISSHYNIFFKRLEDFHFEDELIPTSVLKREMIMALQRNWMLFRALWFQKFFNKLEGKARIFYSDEFYAKGRTLSHAIANSKNQQLTAYGVQHGLFHEAHTVYWIKDRELAADERGKYEGMPKPQKFLVWGRFFKSFFLSKNSLPDEYVYEVGNLAYQKSLASANLIPRENDVQDILWCTTLMIHAEHEYRVIEGGLLNNKEAYKLCIRLHPAGHIKEEEILSLLAPEIRANTYFDQIPQLRDSFASRDLVICSGISTSFLDSLMAKKLTCNILAEMAWDAMKELQDIPFLHVIKRPEEFGEILAALKQGQEYEAPELEIISYLKEDRWEGVLAAKNLEKSLG